MMRWIRFSTYVAFLSLIVLLGSCNLFSPNNNNYCTEEPRPIGDWEPPFYYGVEGTISPDGRYLAFVYHGNRWGTDTVGLFLCDLETEEYRPIYTGLPGQIGIVSTPDFSPDGQWIVFSMGAQIWKIKVNGDSLTQLTFSGRNFYPRWSPDGRRIVFDSNRDAPHGENVIWMMNSDGSNPRRLNEWGEGERRMPSFNPTGDRIIHIRWGVPNGPAIALMDTTGGNVEIIMKASDIGAIELYSPRYSPDGTKIVFVAFRSGEEAMVWVMNDDGSDPVALAVGRDASWTWDGKGIIYTNYIHGGVWRMDTNGCDKKVLTEHFKQGGVQ